MMKYHLLTGATGLLGRYLLRDLTLADVPLAVVVRASRSETAVQRIETAMARWESEIGRALCRPVVLEGDITQAGLGLSPQDEAWVARHVSTMIHSAASLSFYADSADGEPMRSNVHGTRNVLELCRLHGIRQFHHVSTAYVCGRRRGRILETELDLGQEPGNDYERTKIASEKEVVACGHFDQVTVYRPSIIVGDSRTGYTTSYHGFYTPLRLVHAIAVAMSLQVVRQNNWLGGLTLGGDERKNFVAVDWVSAAMTHLITHPETHGRTYHLTNPQPVTVGVLAEAIDAALGEALRNRAVPRSSRPMPSEEMVASFREQMKVYQSYWSDDPDFDSSRAEAALPHLPCPQIDADVMQRLMGCAINANFGWPKETSIRPRHDLVSMFHPWLRSGDELPVADDRRRHVGLRVSGSGGGQWHLVLDDNRLVAAAPGLPNGDSSTCHLTSDTFSRLAGGRLSWETALDTGRLVVVGRPLALGLITQWLRDLAHKSTCIPPYRIDHTERLTMTPEQVLKSAASAAQRNDESLSAQILERGRRSIAGGDSSTMRVLPYHIPLVAERGEGCRLWDVDGNEYIDLNMAYGPLLLGHCPRAVIDAVYKQISEHGSQLGFPTEVTIRVAEKIKKLFPSMELMRFANSGTEACASAVRLARTFTGRKKLIMFEGHYHGWSEAVFTRYHAPLDQLPASGFGPAIPGTTGMGDSIRDVIVVQWNDVDALQRCLEEHGDEVAAVIMEPVAGNAGLLLPKEGYLQTVREMATDNGSLLIFDEVITGMRVARGGAQEYYQVLPDITVVSKAIGGGYPVAAFGASAEIMKVIAQGRLFHGGVFSGNAIVMSAAEAVLDTVLGDENTYPRLNAVNDRLARGVSEIFTRLGVSHQMHHIGSLSALMLTTKDVPELSTYREVRRHCDFQTYIEFQHVMQKSGVYFHPNQFEPMFLSTAHTPADIDIVLDRMEEGARQCLVR